MKIVSQKPGDTLTLSHFHLPKKEKRKSHLLLKSLVRLQLIILIF